MASVDEIFKSAGLSKRRLDVPVDAGEHFKTARLDDQTSPHGSSHPAADERDADVADTTAEQDGQDDEDGRFFQPGITTTTGALIDLIDAADSTEPPPDGAVRDDQWARRLAVSLQKKISKNTDLRTRFEGQPAKFADSERDLDDELRHLSVLADHPGLYGVFAGSGAVGDLVRLLGHDNVDIAVRAAEAVGELTDDDVAASPDEWAELVAAAVEADIVALLATLVDRLDQAVAGGDPDAAHGITVTLGLVEIVSGDKTASRAISQSVPLLSWLICETTRTGSAGREDAIELLAVLSASSAAIRAQLVSTTTGTDAVEAILTVVAPFRAVDPTVDETEVVANSFGTLASLVSQPAGLAALDRADGVALLVMLMRSCRTVRMLAGSTLEAVLAGYSTGCVGAAEATVQFAGLSVIFHQFMKATRFAADSKPADHKQLEWTASLLAIIASLVRLLPVDSDSRLRTLAKLVEKEFEKTDRLVLVRAWLVNKLDQFDRQNGPTSDDSDEQLLLLHQRRLEHGLHALRLVDCILAWLAVDDSGAKSRIAAGLATTAHSLDDIKTTLDQFRVDVAVSDTQPSRNDDKDELAEEVESWSVARQTADMLAGLADLVGR